MAFGVKSVRVKCHGRTTNAMPWSAPAEDVGERITPDAEIGGGTRSGRRGGIELSESGEQYAPVHYENVRPRPYSGPCYSSTRRSSTHGRMLRGRKRSAIWGRQIQVTSSSPIFSFKAYFRIISLQVYGGTDRRLSFAPNFARAMRLGGGLEGGCVWCGRVVDAQSEGVRVCASGEAKAAAGPSQNGHEFWQLLVAGYSVLRSLPPLAKARAPSLPSSKLKN